MSYYLLECLVILKFSHHTYYYVCIETGEYRKFTTRNGMASRTVNLGIVTPMGETNVSGRTKFTRDQIV